MWWCRTTASSVGGRAGCPGCMRAGGSNPNPNLRDAPGQDGVVGPRAWMGVQVQVQAVGVPVQVRAVGVQAQAQAVGVQAQAPLLLLHPHTRTPPTRRRPVQGRQVPGL